MIDLSQDIDSLSHFKRNTLELLARMRQSGRPLVLTVNGKAELVVHDVAGYQRLLDLADRMETLLAVEEGLRDVDAGRTKPVHEVLAKLRAKAAKGKGRIAAGRK
jgi:hypothetical protein